MKARELALVAACWVSGCNGQVEVQQAPSQTVKNQEAGLNHDGASLLRPGFHACVEQSDGSTHGLQSCMAMELVFHDQRLKVALDSLSGLSSSDVVKQSQAQWTARMDRECTWDPATDGEAKWLEADYCRLSGTAVRANELEALLGASD